MKKGDRVRVTSVSDTDTFSSEGYEDYVGKEGIAIFVEEENGLLLGPCALVDFPDALPDDEGDRALFFLVSELEVFE